MMGLLFEFIVIVVFGTLLTHILVPVFADRWAEWVLKISVGTAIGLGISSCVLFVSTVVCGSLNDRARTAEIVILGVASLGMIVWLRRRTIQPIAEPDNLLRSKRRHSLLFLAGIAILCLGVWQFWGYSSETKHGHWDAWAIWNLRARFLALEENNLEGIFLEGYASTHTDYPLLVPLSVARIWSALEDVPTIAPRIVALVFTFTTFAVLLSSTALLRGWQQAMLAGGVLLSTHFFLLTGTWQIADVPLSLYVLVSCSLLVFKERATAADGRKLGVLVGLSAGLAAWTKNEGLLFSVLLLGTTGIVRSRRDGWKAAASEVGWMSAGMLPVLAVVFGFKILYAPASDLLAGQGAETLGWLTDAARYRLVIAGFAESIFEVTRHFVWGLPVYLLVVGLAKSRTGIAMPTLLLLALFAGYFCVFLVSPRELNWHVDTAGPRLVLQMWPSSILLFFLLAASPEELSHGESRGLWQRLSRQN